MTKLRFMSDAQAENQGDKKASRFAFVIVLLIIGAAVAAWYLSS
ncbi:MAG: hypothetical protein ACYCY6_01070 [Minisyncoccota bacterium]